MTQVSDGSGMLRPTGADEMELWPVVETLRTMLNMPAPDRAEIGVILGSGLGSAAERLMESGARSVGYADIPGMPVPHVPGHAGRIVFGNVLGRSVIILQGRAHLYEGHSDESVVFGVKLLSQLGIEQLIITNAAGGICDRFVPGDLMLISDHLSLSMTAEQRFHACTAAGPRFGSAARSRLWSENLRGIARGVRSKLKVHSGVYGMMTGPSYETPAEIRMLRTMGADAVGMSTVPEALCAASLGIEVFGVSCITNLAAGLSDQALSHQEVTATSERIETSFTEWLWNLIMTMGHVNRSVRGFGRRIGPT